MSCLPFHPLINSWFHDTFGKPTPVQEEAWPLIAKGENVLALAPTGSGKTLTGFLAAISRFADGTYPGNELSVLYISPLKALNEDIKRNLILPLEEIKKRFMDAGESLPGIRVETRSGDTPQAERRRFLLRPPPILALTPESLGIILLNPKGRQALSRVRYVIIDEIHSTLGSKRGCYLSCQIDRLSLIAGEFQRVALSATVKPPETAAEFAGGIKKTENGYVKRKVHIVSPMDKKELSLKVIFPGGGQDSADGSEFQGTDRFGKRYSELIKFIIERIKTGNGEKNNGTILVFTDSRRRAERISYLLNTSASLEPDFGEKPLAYTHHGSLSKDVRRAVEKALAEGELPCVVATGSLELGIDIGSVKEVILAGSPGSSAIALQRIGRSGHSVGMTSRGWLVPFHGMDLVEAAAISGAVEERELEETKPIDNPLDILAQIILAFTTERDWNEDELYETLLGFYTFKNLSRVSYDGVVAMLSGAYEDTRYRELKRNIFRDEKTGTLSAAPGALLLLYTSGGVITSRGYYSLRLAQGEKGAGTKIGELDEEFVFERRLGDCFEFGNNSWKIIAITSEAVEAVPLSQRVDFVPFWKGGTVYRSPIISRRILEMLAKQGQRPPAENSAGLSSFSEEAKEALYNFLSAQASAQGGTPLPGPSFIPIEIIDDKAGRGDSYIIIMHSFKGGAINFPLSLALARETEACYSMRVEGTADDNAVFLRLPRSINENPASIIKDSLCRLSAGSKGEERFRERLESSGVFGAAFREAAERSLLLPRSPYGKRIPLWVMREKSRRLFDAVSTYRNFPAAAEAWRTCLVDTFDMEGFAKLLDEIGSGEVKLEFFTTRKPSPFSREMAFAETSVMMYEYDERPDLAGPPGKNKAGPSLSDQVINEALGQSRLRPPLKASLVLDFCSRLRRELSGWAPEDELTLSEWVKERVAIPNDEWEILQKYIPEELKEALGKDKSLNGKLEYVKRKGANTAAVVHTDRVEKWKEAESEEIISSFLPLWLRYEGPLPLFRIEDVFGFSQAETEKAVQNLLALDELAEEITVKEESSSFPAGQKPENVYTGSNLICDRENLELLLRLSRRKQRPVIKERPPAVLVPLLARRQSLFMKGGKNISEIDAILSHPWEKLAGFPAPAKLWETEFFPCRSPSYQGETLDSEIREGRLIWYGTGREKIAFSKITDIDLVLPPALSAPLFSGRLPSDFFDKLRDFWEIKGALGEARSEAAAEALWKEVWKSSLSADSFEPLRYALLHGFASKKPGERESSPFPAETARDSPFGGRSTRRLPRALRERWKTGTPVKGNWFSLAADSPVTDSLSILEEQELNRERVQLLLNRYGVLARPLLEREAPLLSWSKLMPAIRRMELSGELVAGRFFGGINSLQFASPGIAEELEEAESNREIYWMNAADPASPAGLDAEGVIKTGEMRSLNLPVRRVVSTRLCFRGSQLIAISSRGGRELEFFISPDDPGMEEVLSFIKFPKTRKIGAESRLIVEKINRESAARSIYSAILVNTGFIKDRGKIVLW